MPATTARPPRHLPLASATPAGPRASASAVVPFADGQAEAAVGSEETDRLFQVGDIAKATGKTVRALHHYEEIGLLRPHARSKGRFRLYDETALARVRWIDKLHALGLSLARINEIVQTWEQASSAPNAMAQLRSIYLQKLEDTRSQVERLTALERELKASLEYLNTCETCDPSELVPACVRCNVHSESQVQPDLVAGIHGGACCGSANSSAISREREHHDH